MTMALLIFLVFVSITLVITYWAARRSSGANAFFAANRQITPGKTDSQSPGII